MQKKILNLISLKKLFKYKKNDVVWLQVPNNLKTQADRDKVMEATMNKLEQIIYKSI